MSTRGQGDDSRDSRNRQKTSAEAWIVEHGKGEYYLSKDVFEDAGKSGYKGKHIELDEYGKAKGELMRFIQLVEASKIQRHSLLLIDSFDRFSRLPPSKALTLFLQVIDNGIGLVFTGSYDKRIVTSELIDKEPNVLQFIIGEMIRSFTESAEKSRKVKLAKASKKAKMQAGEIVAHNNIPKYFTYEPLTKANGRYTLNDNAKLVRELVESILAGKSLYAMACDLNKRKVKTFRYGNNWHPCSIREILKNRCLVGEYLGNKGYVPALIDESQFNQVQNILNNNKQNRGKRADLLNVFRGLCYCGSCGKQMNVMSAIRKGVSYRYLRCSNLHTNEKVCRFNNIRLEAMEQDFVLKFLAKDPYKLVNPEDSTELASIQKQIASKTSRLNAVSEGIKRLFAMSEGMDIPEAKESLDKLYKERESIKGELDELNLKINYIQDAPKIGENLFENLFTIADESGKPMFKGKGRGIEITHKAKGKEWTEIVIAGEDDAPWFYAYKALGDNEWREKLRVVLPSLIGKVTVLDHKFKVFNRMGKQVFESEVYPTLRNSTKIWKDSLKTWTKRKVGNGKVIVCKRYQRKAKVERKTAK